MLSLFRSNQFIVAVPLALYVLLLHLGALLGYVQPSPHAVEGGFLYQACFGWAAKSPFFSALAAAAIVFLQALAINILADEFRLMGERNWFPGLFYALMASALPEFLFVSPPLAAVTFVPFSIWCVFKTYQKPNVHAALFDGALWIAVAGLFYPPAIWLLVASFAGFGVVRVFRLRERIIFLAGAFVPLFLAWSWYFWADQGAAFRDAQWGNLFQVFSFVFVWEKKMMINTSILGLFALVLLVSAGSLYSRKGIQAQKFLSVLYWFFAISILSLLLRPEWRWEHFLLSAASMGVLLSLLFQGARNRQVAEFWHFVILAFVLFIQFSDFILSFSIL